MKQLSKEELADLVYGISQSAMDKEMQYFLEDVAKLDKTQKHDAFLAEVLGLLSATNARVCNETIIETISKLNEN